MYTDTRTIHTQTLKYVLEKRYIYKYVCAKVQEKKESIISI